MSSFAPGFAMTHAQLASATLDAIKARAVALESPLSDEEAAALGSMEITSFNTYVPRRLKYVLLSLAGAHRGEVTEEKFNSTMEHVSSMPKEKFDEMLRIFHQEQETKIENKEKEDKQFEEQFERHYGGVEALATFRADMQAKKDQRIAMLKELMAAGDINATARACWKILLDQIKKTCWKIEMEVFYDAVAQIDLEGKPEWANMDFSTLIPDLGERCPDWEPVTGLDSYDPGEMKFVDPATGKVCGLRFAQQGTYSSYGCDGYVTSLELVHPGGKKEIVVSGLEYED
jgi:hypothetical protein